MLNMGVPVLIDLRLHSVDSSCLLSLEGCQRLYRITKAQKEDFELFVLSPVSLKGYEMHSLFESAKDHDEKLWSSLEKHSETWRMLVDLLLEQKTGSLVLGRIKQGFSDIEDLLKAIWLTGYVSSGSLDFLDRLLSRWAADILSCYFTTRGEDAAIISYDELALKKENGHHLLFIYGVLSREDAELKTATLASVLNAKGVTFWNNRSLLRSADINEVPAAKVIPSLTYQEATELSFFGAPVIHPHALLPAINAKIDVQLRWWGDEQNQGTTITGKVDTPLGASRVKGFSIIHQVALINIEGAGMSGVPLIASRLFTALGREGISVILISQASSEYSICFAVPEAQARLACQIAGETFSKELETGQIHKVESELDCAILAAVGQQMSGQIGVAGKFFSSLAQAKVNVRSIAQGSSESNISAVIKNEDSTRALRALHAGFFLSKQALSIGLFGPGNIGGTLLDQIAQQNLRLKDLRGLDIHVRGIASSKRMLLDEEGVDLNKWRSIFEQRSVPLDMNQFLSHVGATYFPHSVIVDCTASASLAEEYVSFMNRGMHVITPNKKACTSSYAYYQELFDTSLRTGRRFLYETTVGAALPVLCTLRDLVQTGDRIHHIEGIVSGTLAWLFNNYDGSVPFSTLVRQAKEMGYTEPDPRDDLSGMDVGRKTVILAREMGFHTEVEEIPIESLVPGQLQSQSLDRFLNQLDELDEPMRKRYEEASAHNMKLSYVGMVDEKGNCSASLRSYPMDHPFSQATGTDNVICFTTDRYFKQPLVIKGPGAGRDVTAGGVFADILRLGAYLGARI